MLERHSSRFTSFLEKKALLDIMKLLLYSMRHEPSSLYVCLRENNASMEVNKERDPKPSERMCHKKIFSSEEMSVLSIYKSAPELFSN